MKECKKSAGVRGCEHSMSAFELGKTELRKVQQRAKYSQMS